MEKRMVPDEVKKFLRAVLLSEQGGVPVRRLCKDYQNLIGHVLDWRGLGFSTLEDFVKAMPDVCRLEAFGPEKELRVYGIGDNESFMSSFAISAQIVKGPPKKRLRNRCKRKGQKSSPARKGSPKGSTCNGSGDNPYGLQPDHHGRYSVCMKRRFDCSDQDIKRFFSAAGQVQDVHHSETITFVRFKTVREATAAVDGLPPVLLGRDITVAPAKSRSSDASLEPAGKRLTERTTFVSGKRSPCYPERKAESPTSQYPVHELIATHLTRDTTEEEIWKLFAPFGVTEVRVKKQGGQEYGYAFIHFTSAKSVDKAIEVLDNSVFNGQQIQVELTKRAQEARKLRLGAEQDRGVQANRSRDAEKSTNNSDSGFGLSAPTLPKGSSSAEQSNKQEPSLKFMSYSTMAQMLCECSGDQEVTRTPSPMPAASYPEEFNVIVTEVVDGCHFWGQVNLEGKNNLLELQELQTGLNQLCPAPPLPPGEKTGAALFEGEWYRVWVQEELPEEQLQVVFVDFGNTAVLPCTEVSPLLISEFWDLPPQAVPFKLAGLTPATSNGHDKLKEILSLQVVSVMQSQSGTCEPHILEVEVYIPNATDCASVNFLMKKESSKEGHSFTEKPSKGSAQEEPKCQSNSSKFVPIADDNISDHSVSKQKASIDETRAKGDVISISTARNQETKHSSLQKEAGRKLSEGTFQQRSDERDHQMFQSPFLSEKEEAMLKKIGTNNQRMEKPYHTDIGRRHQETLVGQQQRLMGRQQGTVQHRQGLLGTPVTQYVPQLQFRGQRFAFEANVSEVVTPELFYIQSTDSTLLNKVSQSLQDAANKRTAQELSDMKTLCHETGQVMCTYSDKHHMWRRVRIMGVLPHMVNVQHVDYGTMDLTQLHNLFPLPPDLLSVPILARPACLATATPLPKDNGCWTEGANAFLKGLTANKVLYAEVSGEQAGGKLVVTLWDSVEKKTNICQQLVDQNYAAYSQAPPPMPVPPLNPSLIEGKQPLLPTPQPPQISSQPFFVQDKKPHFPIPQYPVPYQHPAPKQRISLTERFSQHGNQQTRVPVFGGGGAFRVMVRAEDGKERIASRGEKSGPPIEQSRGAGDSDERSVKKDRKDQEIRYGATARNGDGNKMGPSFATMQSSKFVSHNVKSAEKPYDPHRHSRNIWNKSGGSGPLSLGAQRNILHQIVGDMEETSNKSETNSDYRPENKVERERRYSGTSEQSIELANRLQQRIQIDIDNERKNASSIPSSKSPAANQQGKDLLDGKSQGCLATTSGMSAVDLLTSQLIELHTEE